MEQTSARPKQLQVVPFLHNNSMEKAQLPPTASWYSINQAQNRPLDQILVFGVFVKQSKVLDTSGIP